MLVLSTCNIFGYTGERVKDQNIIYHVENGHATLRQARSEVGSENAKVKKARPGT